MYDAVMVKLLMAHTMNSARSKPMTLAQRQVPLRRDATTAWLSEWNSIRLEDHSGPQVEHARAIG